MKTARSLFLFFTFFLLWSVCAADVVPKTVTADSTTQVLVWPTNLWAANASAAQHGLGYLTTINTNVDVGSGRVGAETFWVNSSTGEIWMWDGDSWLQIRDAMPLPTASTPVFSPISGTTFSTTLPVTITCATAGASVYYTTDGSTPDSGDTLYSGAVTLTETTTLKAIAYASGYDASAVRTGTYTYVPLSIVYWGKSASETLDSAGIMALLSTNVAASAGNYAYALGSGYSYFAAPADWDNPTSLKIGTFDVPLKQSSPYDTAFGSLYCMIVAVDGTDYRVFRTYNTTSGAWTMTVE